MLELQTVDLVLFVSFYFSLFLIQTWLRGCDVTSHIMVTYVTVTISHDQKKFIEGSRTDDVMQHSYNILIL